MEEPSTHWGGRVGWSGHWNGHRSWCRVAISLSGSSGLCYTENQGREDRAGRRFPGAQPEFGGHNCLTPPHPAVSLHVFVVSSPALKSSVPRGPWGQACSVRPELPPDGWGVRLPSTSPGLPDVGDSCVWTVVRSSCPDRAVSFQSESLGLHLPIGNVTGLQPV